MMLFLHHGRPHGVPIMEVTHQYLTVNLRWEDQIPNLCMWVLQILWTSGLVAKTPCGCSTLLVLWIHSRHGLPPGAVQISMVLILVNAPSISWRLPTPWATSSLEVYIHHRYGPMTFWTSCIKKDDQNRMMMSPSCTSRHISWITLGIPIMHNHVFYVATLMSLNGSEMCAWFGKTTSTCLCPLTWPLCGLTPHTGFIRMQLPQPSCINEQPLLMRLLLSQQCTLRTQRPGSLSLPVLFHDKLELKTSSRQLKFLNFAKNDSCLGMEHVLFIQDITNCQMDRFIHYTMVLDFTSESRLPLAQKNLNRTLCVVCVKDSYNIPCINGAHLLRMNIQKTNIRDLQEGMTTLRMPPPSWPGNWQSRTQELRPLQPIQVEVLEVHLVPHPRPHRCHCRANRKIGVRQWFSPLMAGRFPCNFLGMIKQKCTDWRQMNLASTPWTLFDFILSCTAHWTTSKLTSMDSCYKGTMNFDLLPLNASYSWTLNSMLTMTSNLHHSGDMFAGFRVWLTAQRSSTFWVLNGF